MRVICWITGTQGAARTLTAVTLHCHAPLQAGHPVFQRLIAYARKSLEYWIARSSRATTAQRVQSAVGRREKGCQRASTPPPLLRPAADTALPDAARSAARGLCRTAFRARCP